MSLTTKMKVDEKIYCENVNKQNRNSKNKEKENKIEEKEKFNEMNNSTLHIVALNFHFNNDKNKSQKKNLVLLLLLVPATGKKK